MEVSNIGKRKSEGTNAGPIKWRHRKYGVCSGVFWEMALAKFTRLDELAM